MLRLHLSSSMQVIKYMYDKYDSFMLIVQWWPCDSQIEPRFLNYDCIIAMLDSTMLSVRQYDCEAWQYDYFNLTLRLLSSKIQSWDFDSTMVNRESKKVTVRQYDCEARKYDTEILTVRWWSAKVRWWPSDNTIVKRNSTVVKLGCTLLRLCQYDGLRWLSESNNVNIIPKRNFSIYWEKL